MQKRQKGDRRLIIYTIACRCASHTTAGAPMAHRRLLVSAALTAAILSDECGNKLDLHTVDIGSSDSGNALLAAFRGVGAAALVDHGVDVDATLAAARALIEKTSAATKRRLDAKGSQRGYLARGAEAGALGLREAKEGFAFGATGNRWPLCGAGHLRRARAVLEGAHINLTRAARRVVALAVAAGATRLENCCAGDATEEALSRLFAYDEYAEGFTGSSPHTDWGLLTLVVADDVAGGAGALEFDDGGVWRKASAQRNALIANAGDFMALAANTASPFHRVVLGPEKRLSLVYFFYPDSLTLIPPATESQKQELSILQCQAESCSTERPETFGELIASKWREVSRS